MAARSRPATPSTPQLELDNQLCFALYDASRAVVRAYGPLLDELGLTYPQYITMLVLWENDAPTSMGDIGAKLHLDSGTLTPLIKRLLHLGVVERARDTSDERRVLVSLTDAGRALRLRACDVPGQMFDRFGMGAHQARDLLTNLNHLIAQLETSS